MARELEETTPTADEVEDWLRYPEVWRLMEPIRQEARINTAVEDAVKKIFTRGYARRYFERKRRLERIAVDLQVKIATAKAKGSTRRIMSSIDHGLNLQGKSMVIRGAEFTFFTTSPSLNKQMPPDNYYKLQTSGYWDEAARADFNADKLIPPHIIACRMAVLNTLGFKMDDNSQIIGDEVSKRIIVRTELFHADKDKKAVVDVFEHKSPELPQVSLLIFKPQSHMDRLSIHERISIRP